MSVSREEAESMAGEETAKVARLCTAAKESGKLNLAECKLTSIPHAVFFLMKETQLQEADFSKNELKKLTPKVGTCPEFQTITSLHLDQNRLVTLPDSLSELQELCELTVSANMLTEVPMCIRPLDKLRLLDLSSNQITQVDAHILRQLPSLEEINLEGNPLDPSCRSILASVVDLKIRI